MQGLTRPRIDIGFHWKHRRIVFLGRRRPCVCLLSIGIKYPLIGHLWQLVVPKLMVLANIAPPDRDSPSCVGEALKPLACMGNNRNMLSNLFVMRNWPSINHG